MISIPERIIGKISDFYFSSRDFSGIPLADLYRSAAVSEPEFKKTNQNFSKR
jgi:hypothetical protein